MVYGWDARPMRAGIILIGLGLLLVVVSFCTTIFSGENPLGFWLRSCSVATGLLALVSLVIGVIVTLSTYADA